MSSEKGREEWTLAKTCGGIRLYVGCFLRVGIILFVTFSCDNGRYGGSC